MHTDLELANSPIAQSVERLRATADSLLHIAGWSADGSRCLIVSPAACMVTVATFGTPYGFGRWECTYRHLREYIVLYQKRYPRLNQPLEGISHGC